MIASITFYPNLTKKNGRSNLIPIYIRVAFKRAKSESRLNVSINEADQSKWDPMIMRMLEKNSVVNLYLNNIQKQFNDFIILNSTELPKYSATQIKEYVLGVYDNKVHVTMIEFVDGYFNNTVLNNVNCTAGTMKNYRRAVNHLKAYLKHTQQEKMAVVNLDLQFANDFKSFLVNRNPSLDRNGMTEVSAAAVIKKFRTIFSWAAEYGLISQNQKEDVNLLKN